MPRALITGIAGFAGSHLAEHLLDRGDEVWGFLLDRASTPNLTPIISRLQLVEADVTDLAALAPALERAAPDRIYHLAGYASPGLSFSDPLGCYGVNVLGTAALFEGLRRLGARPRVLSVGSGESYGRAGDRPIPETTPQRPVSPYGASKAAAEMVAIAAFEAHGIPAIRVRAFNHIGARQDPAFATAAFAKQIAEAEAGLGPGEIRVGNLSPVRDLADVRDVVEAYRLLMERGAPGEVYNVATGRGTPVKTVVEHLVARARVPLAIVDDPARFRAASIECLIGDPGRLFGATGFRFARPLDETLDTVLEDWRRRVALSRA